MNKRNNGQKILNRINAFKSNNSLKSIGSQSDSNKKFEIFNNKFNKIF